jgi:hypothetical protein
LAKKVEKKFWFESGISAVLSVAGISKSEGGGGSGGEDDGSVASILTGKDGTNWDEELVVAEGDVIPQPSETIIIEIILYYKSCPVQYELPPIILSLLNILLTYKIFK